MGFCQLVSAWVLLGTVTSVQPTVVDELYTPQNDPSGIRYTSWERHTTDSNILCMMECTPNSACTAAAVTPTPEGAVDCSLLLVDPNGTPQFYGDGSAIGDATTILYSKYQGPTPPCPVWFHYRAETCLHVSPTSYNHADAKVYCGGKVPGQSRLATLDTIEKLSAAQGMTTHNLWFGAERKMPETDPPSFNFTHTGQTVPNTLFSSQHQPADAIGNCARFYRVYRAFNPAACGDLNRVLCEVDPQI